MIRLALAYLRYGPSVLSVVGFAVQN